MSWLESIGGIEEYEDVALDAALVAELERAAAGAPQRSIRFSTPTFKDYASTELKGCAKNSFPSFSITAGACGLNCDHCRAEILKPMLAATSPAMLDQKVRHLIATQDLQGFLLSGGSNRRNEIPYERFYPVVEQLKRDFPYLSIAIHTALTDEAGARAMEAAGVDTAMMDVIGADETIREVYHLDRPVADFEATLAALTATSMNVSPHIVIGLHYGRVLGEPNALDIVSRYPVEALVLVVVMPFYALPGLFAVPDTADVGRIFAEARRRLHDRAGAARLRAAAGPAQACRGRLCRDGGPRRHRLPGRRGRGRGPRHRPAVPPGARLLLHQARGRRPPPRRAAPAPPDGAPSSRGSSDELRQAERRSGERPAGPGPGVQRLRGHAAAPARTRRPPRRATAAREGRRRAAAGRVPAELQRAHAADALARVRADVERGGDHARHHAGQDAPLRLHALPQPAAHLPGRLPRQLRVLRPRAAPRGRARLRRPQLHPRRLAGGADAAGGRHRRPRRRSEPVPPHVHLDDHASALGRGHGGGAEGLDGEDRPGDDPGVDPVESRRPCSARTSRA